MAEEHRQALGQAESEKPVRKAQQQILLCVLGEEQGSLLAAGGAEVKALAAERTEQLLLAIRICVLYAGDALGVIAAGEKALGYLGDPLQAEPSVRGGVLLLIVFGEPLEVLFEYSLKDVRSARSIGGGGKRGLKSERQLAAAHKFITGQRRISSPVAGRKGEYLAYCRSGFLDATFSVYFKDTLMGALALHSFTQMIRRRYEDESIRILVSEEEILFKNEALLDVLAGEGEPERAVG